LGATDALVQKSAANADSSAPTITSRPTPSQQRHASSEPTGFPLLKASASGDIQKGISRDGQIDHPGLSNNRFRSWLRTI
jgi:hypothetical protein